MALRQNLAYVAVRLCCNRSTTPLFWCWVKAQYGCRKAAQLSIVGLMMAQVLASARGPGELSGFSLPVKLQQCEPEADFWGEMGMGGRNRKLSQRRKACQPMSWNQRRHVCACFRASVSQCRNFQVKFPLWAADGFYWRLQQPVGRLREISILGDCATKLLEPAGMNTTHFMAQPFEFVGQRSNEKRKLVRK